MNPSHEITDAELIQAVATEVMRYKPVYTKVNGTKCLIGWDRPDGKRIQYHQFMPLTNANHWMMVVERMRELGYSVVMNSNWENKKWSIWFGEKGRSQTSIISHHNILGRAVCEAAVEAERGG